MVKMLRKLYVLGNLITSGDFTFEPRHEKTVFEVSDQLTDSNQAAQLQKLARVLILWI